MAKSDGPIGKGMGEPPSQESLESAAVRRHMEGGIALLEQGDANRALEHFQSVHDNDPGHARSRSYYGLCLSLAEQRFEKSVELCRSAVKQEFFNPELYLNLARVHLSFGFKAEGIRYLRRGQMIDPANGAIQRELRDLGCRQRQVLGFLPRHHLLNRLLGRARIRVPAL
ncbi:MAG: hypothetical protein O7G30_09535 [Proteobacteria bacterium]|nr:hypothetical protein [Pseudomonadota bacterium]